MKFVGICLITKNVPALARFYTQVLGVQAEGDDRHVELQTEGAHISLFSVDGMEQIAPQSMRGAGMVALPLDFKLTMLMANTNGSSA